MKAFLRSVRFKLVFNFVIIFGLSLVLMGFVTYNFFTRTHLADFDAALFNHALDVGETIDLNFFGDLTIREFSTEELAKRVPFPIQRSFLQIRDNKGAILARSRNLSGAKLPYDKDIENTVKASGVSFRFLPSNVLPNSRSIPSKRYRMITYAFERPNLPELTIQIAAPLTSLENSQQVLRDFFWYGIPVVLIIATLLGLTLTSRALAPVNRLIEKTRAIEVGRFDQRVPVPRGDRELEELGITLNDLLSRVEHALSSQENFVANASHQLKTPLAILVGELEELQRSETLSPETQKKIESLKQEVRNLSRLVHQLLLLAKVDLGTDNLEKTTVRTDEVLVDLLSKLEKLSRSKNIKIQTQILEGKIPDNQIGFEVPGDSGLLSTLFENLIENAIKYSPEHSNILVELFDLPNSVRLKVTDHGPGVSKDSQSRLFERFFRDPVLSKNTSGSGLGLSLAQRISEIHNGRVWFEPLNEESGSVFFAEIGKTHGKSKT